MACPDDIGLIRFSELVHGSADSRKPLRIIVVADQQAAGANLWPPRFGVGFDRFVAVFAVDKDEVEFSVVEAAGGFGRRQADRMPAAGVDSELT